MKEAVSAGLTEPERERYARQLSLPEFGDAGQARLKAARVLVAGLGGLGSPAAYFLAAAGVGTLILADGDTVDASNLQRQILHTSGDVGRLKTDSAAAKLRALNPHVTCILHARRIGAGDARALVEGCDFVIDATDNFPSKFVLADACYAAGVPCCHAGVDRFEGQLLTVLPGRSACYRCIGESPPPPEGSVTRGPLGVVPGVLGALQATEAIKHLAGCGTLLTDCLLTYDARRLAFRGIDVRRRADCPLCGQRRGGEQ